MLFRSRACFSSLRPEEPASRSRSRSLLPFSSTTTRAGHPSTRFLTSSHTFSLRGWTLIWATSFQHTRAASLPPPTTMPTTRPPLALASTTARTVIERLSHHHLIQLFVIVALIHAILLGLLQGEALQISQTGVSILGQIAKAPAVGTRRTIGKFAAKKVLAPSWPHPWGAILIAACRMLRTTRRAPPVAGRRSPSQRQLRVA